MARADEAKSPSYKEAGGWFAKIRGKSAAWKKLQNDEEMKAGRAVYGEPSVVVDEGHWKMYLGSVYNANDAEGLARHDITYVLNVAQEAPEDCRALVASIRVLGPPVASGSAAKIMREQYLKIDIEDLLPPEEMQLDTFEECFAFIEKAREAEANVLVHCMRGRSRSTSVVLYYMMKRLRMPLLDAHTHVKEVRPIVGPHYHLKLQLLRLEQEVLGVEEPSAREAWLRKHY